jgi:hypothetical protein
MMYRAITQAGFLMTNGEGRGFNPAVSDASNYSPVSRPAQSRAGTARGARGLEGREALCGGVKTPPFRMPD